ncbi:MAG: S-layer homology domain-containing protein, partial [Oscillospiraceae bacterium]|nr:S-layer homology domain-containing protein [Oscillospiraceae bacterium]
PNAQILAVNVYVSSEEYTKGAELDWGEVVGSSDWALLNGPGGRDLPLDEVQYNVRSIRIEVTKVNGNTNIRCSEVYVSVGTPKKIAYEYAYLTPDEVTGYADSVFGTSSPAYALDDNHGTNWHTNYNEPDGGTSDDPFVQGNGGSLTGNNNFYIVLDEKLPVDKLAFYLDERNANIKTVNVYVSDEDYGENQDIDWGDVVATGTWAKSGGRIEELAFPAPEMNVKTIRLEVTEVHGNTNIRGIDFYVSAGKPASQEPEQPDQPEEPDEPEVPGEKPLFTLAVLADPHIDAGIERWDPPIRTSVTNTVKEMAKSEDVDLVAFPGDIVSSHLGSYWGSNPAQKQQTFNNVKAALMDAVNTATDTGRAVFVAGNHDLRVGMLDFNSGDYSDEMEPALGALVAAESVDDVRANAFYQKNFPAGTASGVEHVLAYHYNVDGLDFIMLNPPFQMDENVYYYDAEALQWVANKMADIGDDQTVFLVGHYPLCDGKDGAPDTDAETHRILKEEILNNYPKSIYVYGHYHTQVVYSDTYERLNTYMSDGSLCLDRDAVTDGFITVSGGSMAYYGDAVSPSGGLGAATPNVVQALLVYVYADRIVFQMKNYGTENFGVEEIKPYVVYRDVDAEDDVSGLKEALKEALKAAEEAEALAEEAKKAAEDAYTRAEAAQAAAEEAAGTSAENMEAARKAREAAEAAQAEAEATAQAAQTAAAAAEAARLAAEQANVSAAQEALKAAQEAANAAASAQLAAAEAARAAESQAKAQEAQAKAEAAQLAAEDARARAEAAKAAAEEAEQSTAENKEAAEAARSAADAAQAAAEAAEVGAESARMAAEAAAEAADNSNAEAAAEALKAAEAAAEAAEQAVLVAQYAAAAAEAQAKAQEAQAKAEEAQRAAEDAQRKAEQAAEEARRAAELEYAKQEALMEIMLLNMETDTDSMIEEQLAAYRKAMMDAIAAITAAEDQQTVADALEKLKAAVEEIVDFRCPSEAYVDVEKDTWYHEYVDYMLIHGYMNGVSGNMFDVSGTTTRGQLVTILYRIAGQPSVEGMENRFVDVEAGVWYTDAIVWAANEGIVNGVSANQFMPNEKVTRQQIVTILYRYAKAEPVAEDHLAGFTDADQVADFAKDAMNWAVGEGLVNGVSATLLAPDDTAIRVQICAILMRFLEK